MTMTSLHRLLAIGWPRAARWAGMLAGTLLVALIVASSAYATAGFGIERYVLTLAEENGSTDTQAGSHPYELTAEAVLEPKAYNTGADEVRNLDFELPPGLIINPAHVLQNSAVGTVQVSVAGKIVSAAVYNVAPAPGDLASFDFSLEGVPVVTDISVRTGDDYGMTLNIKDLPQREIESVKLTLGGPSISRLLTLPTSCAGSLQTTFQGESWGAETAFLSASLPRMTGCEGLSFDPSISVAPDTTQADEPAGYELDIRLPQDEQSCSVPAARGILGSWPRLRNARPSPSLHRGLKAAPRRMAFRRSGAKPAVKRLKHCASGPRKTRG